MNQVIIKSFFIMFIAIFLHSCKHDNMIASTPPPLASIMIGKWEWTKTVNELGETITPKTTGNSKSISYGNSDKLDGNYLYLSEKEGVPIVLLQNNNFGRAELLGDTLDIVSQFENKYVEFFLLKDSKSSFEELIRTELVENYSNGFGLTRHYYKRSGVADKP